MSIDRAKKITELPLANSVSVNDTLLVIKNPGTMAAQTMQITKGHLLSDFQGTITSNTLNPNVLVTGSNNQILTVINNTPTFSEHIKLGDSANFPLWEEFCSYWGYSNDGPNTALTIIQKGDNTDFSGAMIVAETAINYGQALTIHHISNSYSVDSAVVTTFVNGNTDRSSTLISGYSYFSGNHAAGAYGLVINQYVHDANTYVNGVYGILVGTYGPWQEIGHANVITGIWIDRVNDDINDIALSANEVIGLLINDQNIVGANNFAIKTGLGQVWLGDTLHVGPDESVLDPYLQDYTSATVQINRHGVGAYQSAVGIEAEALDASHAFGALIATIGQDVTGLAADAYVTVNLDGDKKSVGLAGGGLSHAADADRAIGVMGYNGAYTSGTITDAIALFAASPYAGGAAQITNIYGLFVEDQTIGTSTNYAIKTGLGKVEFGDKLSWKPGSNTAPVSNGDLTFEAANNTTLNIKYKGSDETIRSTTLTLT